MSQKSRTRRETSEKVVEDIRRATRKRYSAEEKIRIVLDGLRGEDRIAELCRREGIGLPVLGSVSFIISLQSSSPRPSFLRRTESSALPPHHRRRAPGIGSTFHSAGLVIVDDGANAAC